LTIREVFVDASAWIALADGSDANHADAVRIYSDLLRQRIPLLTMDLVVAEAQIWIRRRISFQAAITFVEGTNESPQIELAFLDVELEAKTKAILRQYDDQDFSFADATAFALMRQRGILHAFAFEGHFVTAGFILLT
jgi:hypothetical protein